MQNLNIEKYVYISQRDPSVMTKSIFIKILEKFYFMLSKIFFNSYLFAGILLNNLLWKIYSGKNSTKFSTYKSFFSFDIHIFIIFDEG